MWFTPFQFLRPRQLSSTRGPKMHWFNEVLRGFLPSEISNKWKQGFGQPFGVWMQGDAGLNALAHDAPSGLGTRGFVRLHTSSRCSTNDWQDTQTITAR